MFFAERENTVKKKRKTGFTLVELLVVIAIIALLLSILIPAMNKAKESARRVLCGNGLRQVGSAIIMYANAYDQKLPADYYLFPGQSNFSIEGHPYALYRDTWKDATGKLVPLRFAYLYERKFIPEPKLFYCPNNKGWNYRYESYIDPMPWGSLPQKENYAPPQGRGNGNQWVRMGYTYWPTDPDPMKFDEMTESPAEATKSYTNLNRTIPYASDTIWTRNGLSHKSGIKTVTENGQKKVVLLNPGINALFKDSHVVFCSNRTLFAQRIWDLADPPNENDPATVKYPELCYKIFKLIPP
jgi:prepilin-type N-terminal cleavage/methylation domain-containing protein